MEAAFEAVQRGSSVSGAAKKHNIPLTTLNLRIKAGFAEKLKKRGAPKRITVNEDSTILKWIEDSTKRGIGVSTARFEEALNTILKARKSESQSKDQKTKRFCRHHPEVTLQKPSLLIPNSEVTSTGDLCRNWQFINNYIQEKGLTEVFDDPRRVANCDEIFFEYKLRTKPGCRTLYTILADGTQLTPFLVLQRVSDLPAKIRKPHPTAVKYTYSKNGLLTDEDFRYYIEFVFYKQLKEHNVEFPVILFIDHPAKYISFELTKFCQELEIHLICPYASQMQTIQPLDATLYRPLKDIWLAFIENLEVTDATIGQNFLDFYQKSANKLTEFVKEGFKITGLFPWNSENINYERIKKGNLRIRLNDLKLRWFVLKSDEKTQNNDELGEDEYVEEEVLFEVNVEPTNEIEELEKESSETALEINSCDGEMFDEIKAIYGPGLYNKFTDKNFKPKNEYEKVLQKVILTCMPKEMLISLITG